MNYSENIPSANIKLNRIFAYGSNDKTPAYEASIEDLDLTKFTTQFLIDRKDGSKKTSSIDHALHAYGLMVEEHSHQYPTIAGILLFGKNPQKFLPEAFIISTYFKGVEARQSIATKDCTGTLLEQLDCRDIIEQTKLSRSTVGRRLTELVDQETIKRIGKGRATSYRLK